MLHLHRFTQLQEKNIVLEKHPLMTKGKLDTVNIYFYSSVVPQLLLNFSSKEKSNSFFVIF